MEDADEELLRSLIAQVTKIDSKLDQAMTLIGERRRHADDLDTRMRSMEARLHAIELLGAEGKSVPGMLKDHESRIRILEGIKWQLLAIAAAGSMIGGGIVWLLRVLSGG